ncbi:hypothetical protein PF001_g22668 [Phytophthora fragariae]|uniref:Uncharacterized protein n=1 Tax=Phytophthora fragariae TaxID=53985 RepID=A0A6A4CAQ7_9STRA|nr:hypothetical protein PF001_g22668 [Phytophthora fragariae]
MKATTTGLPPYPGHGSVTRRQWHNAELERIKIRAQERERRVDRRVERLRDIPRLPPLPVYDRGVLEAHRAAKIGRARQEELANRLALLGRTTRTRSTDALLSRDNSDSEHRGTERWEARALSTMFGGSSSGDGGALREAFNAIEEADEEPSPIGSDDSDYQDTPSADRDAKEDEQQDEDDAEEDDENQGGEDDEEKSEEDEEEAENEDGDDGEENEEDGGGKEVNELTDQREGDESEQDDEEETDDKFGVAPNLHQIAHQRLKTTQRVRRPFPHFIDGFGTTFDSWADFHEAFEKFQRGTFQQFSKRTSTSVILYNKQIKDQAGTAKRTKKNTRKEMKLLPETWIQYSKTWKLPR